MKMEKDALFRLQRVRHDVPTSSHFLLYPLHLKLLEQSLQIRPQFDTLA
ncbi:hypothetical protein I8752_32725 [Nostocaceae cyanobacterium CENA369]|uniref:Uncharacterized protein n=1 Tax=Dendronalium phyllosphericum CENA369 TaxID=1725256 RepID=A0A8J7IM12_9NOST|nr:hypothetical protein [Dendronalium phyllosphericum CENA369]